MKNLLMFVSTMVMIFSLISSVNASTFVELGDAGELLPTANITVGSGSLTSINGSLIDESAGGDIDLYKISIVDTDIFSVTTPQLVGISDPQLFLFDTNGALVLHNDDFAPGQTEPEFTAGSLSGAPVGMYFLGFNLVNTDPTFTSGSLSGWNRPVDPFETGDYTLAISGAEFSAVPIPAAIWLFSSGFIALIGMRKKASKTFALSV